MRRNNLFSIILDIIGDIAGFLIFIFIVFIINFLTLYIKEQIFIEIVQLINQNIYLICIISIFLLIAKILDRLFIPFNLLAPVFYCLGYIYLFNWFSKLICFLNSKVDMNICYIFEDYRYLFYIIIVTIVIISWYFSIFNNIQRKEKSKKKK